MPVYTTAAVLIVRDEARRIERVLAGVRPHVDRLVVLDTGSTDDTIALARNAGAEVHEWAWADDFAAARNESLQLAAADWHVIIDADEWLIDGGTALQALRHQAPNFVGRVLIDSAFDTPQGRSSGTCRVSRVLPGIVRYTGRVHEQPRHALPVRDLAVHYGHDGYLDEALERKRDRNATLLARELQDRPNDPYLWYQLGKDHDVYRRAADAVSAFAQARACLGNDQPAWLHDVAVRHLTCLKQCGRHAEAATQAEADLPRFADSPDFLFALGDMLFDWAVTEPARAHELLPTVEQAWQECLRIGDRPELEGAVAGSGSFLAEHNLKLLHATVQELELELS